MAPDPVALGGAAKQCPELSDEVGELLAGFDGQDNSGRPSIGRRRISAQGRAKKHMSLTVMAGIDPQVAIQRPPSALPRPAAPVISQALQEDDEVLIDTVRRPRERYVLSGVQPGVAQFHCHDSDVAVTPGISGRMEDPSGRRRRELEGHRLGHGVRIIHSRSGLIESILTRARAFACSIRTGVSRVGWGVGVSHSGRPGVG
jgi:hypothetical protein